MGFPPASANRRLQIRPPTRASSASNTTADTPASAKRRPAASPDVPPPITPTRGILGEVEYSSEWGMAQGLHAMMRYQSSEQVPLF